MHRGLGSCQLEMERCTNIEDFRSEVLWGMQYALAYDAQCEGTRAIYLFEMIERFDDWSEFHAFAAAGAKRNLKDPGWRFFHYAEIIALMAGAGYEPARQTTTELYEVLLQAIRAGRPSRNGVWSALDNYSRCCVSVLTNVLQTQEDREEFYLRVLADYGKILAQKSSLGSRCDDEWFEVVAEEYIGEARIQELLARERDNRDLARYLRNRESLQESREAFQAQRRQEEKEETAESIYEKLCSGAVPGRDLPLLLLRRVEQEDISKLTRLYAEEEREELRKAILRLFRIKSNVSAMEDAAVSRLLKDAESENELLRNEALRVLDDLGHESVRDYALQRLKQKPKDIDALYMLLSNFRPGDGKRLIPMVKAASLNKYNGDWHGVFTEVRNLIEQNSDADHELSTALLPYIYREGFCSCCRLRTLKLMQPRSLLTPELIEECLRDCDLEIREFVEGLQTEEEGKA